MYDVTVEEGPFVAYKTFYTWDALVSYLRTTHTVDKCFIVRSDITGEQ